ncbi:MULTISPECIES: Rossmann-like domain-containing protein [Acidianus]|uniref:Heavy-metal chelation domain-containing protein n=1 Tax=Candidatus Acidianus copahuensis TaxID=1160895 RepID=A0A031LRE3_9CREN|nr:MULTISPECIES: DUF364 domain-containing protein [Acidianus]EZQ06974.1 hypothetical protein CM19_06335 [Candidatus Acidianus copahuensis]NON61998.1 hypothetical protein [Acidianus sp. RZ1]
MILNEIIEELSFDLKKRKIINVCVGTNYTSVLLDNQTMGVSNTINEGEIEYSGEIIGKTAYDLASQIDTPIQRSISTAILNALNFMELNPGDPISLYSGETLCVFGYSPSITANFKEIITYDFSDKPMEKAKAFSSFTRETCDVAVIFGSSLVLNVIDKIVKNVKAEHLILEGVSSVEAPITLKKYGFEAIGKVIPVDKYKAFRSICEGGTSRKLAKYITRMFIKL